ncbi:hypothetical protein CEXT_557101 [Caerostris extrusa]|uniref:C2H2-type domain-containing protein n=1 Tax=Caerostris extrusa TaxID=172846 RepID=A0AAV4MRW3_CAEEX|nr:hypothetical protein CEXT_557101 [Caerostris extrusa]
MRRLGRLKNSKDLNSKEKCGILEQSCTAYKFQCDVCKKHFTSKQALERHCKVHSKRTTNICEACGKLLVCSGVLEDEVVPSRNMCFRSEVSGKHAEDPSGRFSVSKETQRIVCKICKQQFSDSIAFGIHYHKHMKKTLVYCSKCLTL